MPEYRDTWTCQNCGHETEITFRKKGPSEEVIFRKAKPKNTRLYDAYDELGAFLEELAEKHSLHHFEVLGLLDQRKWAINRLNTPE